MEKKINEDVKKKIMHSCDSCYRTGKELICRQCWEKEQEHELAEENKEM